MVTNVANAARMQEEASILVLRIAKITNAKVNLAEVIVSVLPPTGYDKMPHAAPSPSLRGGDGQNDMFTGIHFNGG